VGKMWYNKNMRIQRHLNGLMAGTLVLLPQVVSSHEIREERELTLSPKKACEVSAREKLPKGTDILSIDQEKDVTVRFRVPKGTKSEVKIDREENTSAKELTAKANETTKFIASLRIFPNPAIGEAKISFSVPEKGPVSIKLYNSAGMLVETLIEEIKEPGAYLISWNKRLPTGIYFCVFGTEGTEKIKKVTLLR